MSTPTTATATLPPHYRHHHHPPSHHHHHYPPYQALTTGGASYRSAAPGGGNPTTLPTPASTASTATVPNRQTVQTRQSHYLHPPAASSYTANSAYPVNEIPPNGAVASVAPARHLSTRTHSTPHSEAHHTNMSLSNLPPAPGYAESQPRKRRRSKEPDWEKFYEHGLPKEIIVIDDTPEPEPKMTAASSSRTYINPTVNSSTGNPNVRHVAKKRRKEEGLHNEALYDARLNGSYHPASNSGSASTDRTTTYTTTAPTSLSSTGQYDYEAPQTGQKRKRTRQQIAQDAKRREVEVLGDGFQEYQPPTKPIKKSGEVAVRPVTDVSTVSLFLYSFALLFCLLYSGECITDRIFLAFTSGWYKGRRRRRPLYCST